MFLTRSDLTEMSNEYKDHALTPNPEIKHQN